MHIKPCKFPGEYYLTFYILGINLAISTSYPKIGRVDILTRLHIAQRNEVTSKTAVVVYSQNLLSTLNTSFI